MKNEIVDVKNKPSDVLAFGTSAADMLKKVVNNAKLEVNIQGRKYLKFEGWQTVGKFFKSTVAIEWTRPILMGDKPAGWEARANVLDETGRIISSAEASCGRDEQSWSAKPDFQVRSMAQTRACAKALRNTFSWVVVLAGLEATPAEEMIIDHKAEINTNSGTGSANYFCSNPACKKQVSLSVKNFSLDHFKAILCMDCQKKAQAKAEKPTASPIIEPIPGDDDYEDVLGEDMGD